MGEGLMLSEGVYLSDGTMLAAILIGVALFAVLLLVAARPWHGRHAVSGWSLGLLLGVTALTFTLLAPALWALRDGDPCVAFLQTLFLTIQSPTLNSGAADLVGGVATSPVSGAYYILLNVCYLAMPVLAVINVVDLIDRRFARIRFDAVCRLSVRRRNAYVFSGLGDRELRLAREVLERADRPEVLFSNAPRAARDDFADRIVALDSPHVHFLSEGLTATAERLCREMRFASCHFLVVSDDVARNVAKASSALERIRGVGVGPDGEPNQVLPAFTGHAIPRAGRASSGDVSFVVRVDSPDDPVVLDAANTGGEAVSLSLRTLQDETLAAVDLLSRAPLYTALGQEPASPAALRPATPQTLDVLVLGAGHLAEEVLLSVLWAGQMHNVRLRVTVADEGASALRERIGLRCRELMDLSGEKDGDPGLFSLEFRSVALRSPRLYDQVLDPLAGSEHLYVVAALARGDATNYELALDTRLYLLDRRARALADLADPVIAAYVRDPSMSRLIPSELDVGAKSYGIVTFGASLFGYDTIAGSELERRAQLADDLYGYLYNLDTRAFCGPKVDPLAVRLATSRLMEARSGRREPVTVSAKDYIIYQSNLATALHADYKAWAMGLDVASGESPSGDLSAGVIRSLARVEHDRWWCFYLTYGYSRLTDEQRAYFSARLRDGTRDKNRLRKLEPLRKHTLLCPHAELWDSYVRSMSGFAYGRRLPAGEGGVTVCVAVRCADGSPAAGMRVQLVTAADHLVADEWDVADAAHECPPVPAGEYLLHPCRAVPGRQAGDDVPLTVGAASDGAELEAVVEKTDKLVNTEVYDMAFVCAVWWGRTHAERP